MHTHDTRIMTVYLPWLCAALASALELEGVHRLRRALWGVHPIPAGIGWALLCALAVAGASALGYTLIDLGHALHAHPVGYWLPWVVCLTYLTVVAEFERRAARPDARPNTDPEDV